MSSILTNASALSALQSLTQTQADLKTTEHQVSTGLAVSSAADNASYWSIATQLTSNSGVVTSANQALAQSQSVMSTATSAINSIITTINSIESALTQAATPGASISNINTTLASLGSQLKDAINGASFNGLNLLNGSQTSLNFVAGFNATASGGTVNTIGFTAQSMSGGTSSTTSVAATTLAAGVKLALNYTTPTVAATVGGKTMTNNATEILTGMIGGNTANSATGFTTTQEATNGTVTTSTYTAVGGSVATAANFSVSTVSTSALSTPPTQLANITDSAQVAAISGLADNGTPIAGVGTTIAVGYNVVTKTPGAGPTPGPAVQGTILVQSLSADGALTNTTYSALDANGNTTVLGSAASFSVSQQSTGSIGLLTKGGFDLTNLTTSSATAASQLSAVQNALSSVTTYAATIGATQDRMTAASTFNTALTTNYATGVSALVDADMNTASPRLQALQTQEQLGIQSLSIANQNAQLILKLFP